MGYSYLYIVVFLVLLMFLARIFLPIIIYLLPIFLVIYIVRLLFFRASTKKHEDFNEYTQKTDDSAYDDYTYSSNPDIIDVDYKIVDEKETDNTY